MASFVGRVVNRLASSGRSLRGRFNTARAKILCETAPGVDFGVDGEVINPYARTSVRIGLNTLMLGQLMLARPDAKIVLGDWCYVGPNAKLWAMGAIEVGARVFISHNVHVLDNNSHSLSAAERHERFRERQTLGHHLAVETVKIQPVRIEDDVWIGFNAAILKGVTIGKGAIVGAGAVVVKDVRPYTVVGGNPAREVSEVAP
jgi:acetyltransferase-like isoleucine patch superfamily enzyme